MRKIVSKKNEDKQKQMWLGIVLIIVMFGSVFGVGISFFGQDSGVRKINFNGFEFVEQAGFWYLELGNFVFGFTNDPREVPVIEGRVNYLNSYQGKPLYLSSNNSVVEEEILQNLGQFILRVQKACLEGEDCEDGLPVKTCEDNFIIIEESETMNITQDQNCVFIQGPKDDLVKISDEFLLKVLGVA